ncbi:MAG TPA: aldehyde dehydrogenase family protein [Blastocatellia bacterium]|nr:aldehyde dehydrogenase family protein [Blastocatellia bacterium]
MSGIPEIGQTVFNFIAGKWEPSGSVKWVERYDPADQSVLVARAPDSTRQDAVRAAQAAARAAEQWGKCSPSRRGRLLFDWLTWIDGRRQQIAELLTREEGKILAESLGEVNRSIDILEFTAGMGRRLGGKVFAAEEQNVFCFSNAQPLGVVGLISPWNFPVAIPVWKLAPALIAGNTAVLKPSPLTPLTATALVRGLEEVGLPAGVVNLIHGDSEPGSELVSNELVQGISFTGSTGVGKRIARAASERLAKLQLELGGKNPQLVLEDADLDQAVDGVMMAAFGSSGQRCSATSRAIVAQEVYDDFLERIHKRAASIRIGAGSEPGVEMGPLVDGRAIKRVTHYIGVGQAEGAKVCTGGNVLTGMGYGQGLFFQPTVLEATRQMEVAREEVFGPVLSVIRVRDFEEAINVANSTRYGLAASIFTRDVSRIFRSCDAVQAGTLHVNRPGVGGYSHVPFGGIKESGFGGREIGDEVMSFYTESKVVYINHAG